jgi:peptidoglycan hydrolase-like protein with peptidoglycan-binding domain
VKTLRQGAKGDDVRQLQQAIGVTADGVFGPKTAAALKAYQSAHGLTADGVAGPQTWGAIQGGGAPGGVPGGTAPGVTPPADPDTIKASFGFVGAMADAVPELKTLLQQAIQGQWTNDRFIMAVSGSNWYRSNSDKAREWITLQAVDPATATANQQRSAMEVWSFANNSGIQLNDQQANEAALWRMFNPNVDEDVFRSHLAKTYFNPFMDWHQLTGTAAQYARQIQEIGRNYGWDDYENYDQSRQMLGQMMSGEMDVEGFQRRMVDNAKVLYPGLHDQLLSGMTLKQIADPYMAKYSNILEQPQTAINWYDDKLIQNAMQYKPESGSGKGLESNGAMPMGMFEEKLREDPRWRKTKNAVDSTGALLQQIGKDWGYVGS